jgi:hypothetical protein
MGRLDRTIRINTTVRVMVRSGRTITGAGESTATWAGITLIVAVMTLNSKRDAA